MGKGRTCAGDRIVVEMLAELDEMVLDELAELFRLHALNHHSEDSEEVWDEYQVCLTLKKVAPLAPSMLPHIVILSVLAKLYSATLYHLVSEFVEPISQYQFNFLPKHQSAECVFILRMLIEKSIEWQMPLCFLDGDLPKAYDNVLHP